MKKILVPLGVLTTTIIQVTAVISCAKKTKNITGKAEKTKNITGKAEKTKNITINMRVMDWEHKKGFDSINFDSSKNIQFWSWEKNNNRHMMMPFFIDSSWNVSIHDGDTFGDALDELNKKYIYFKFNIDDKEKAGEMGRMLYGVKKSNDYIKNNNIGPHNQYWGIHEEYKNDLDGWIFNSTDDYDYLSLTSPNNIYARPDSSKYFDRNESFFMFNNRLSRGIDTTKVYDKDILNINTWKMI